MDANEPASEPGLELEAEALLADLDDARNVFEAAERRAHTHLVRRGVLDQTDHDLSALLREETRRSANQASSSQ